MGLFSSLFGKSGSDKADKMRQSAIDAFNSIKTPELSALQVQLDKYVQQGTITPEQAEATLLKSNAFNSIATDPSLAGAQKQALQSLQSDASAGGLNAIDKAKMRDITDIQNQEAQGRRGAILSNARERGVGGSGLEMADSLMNEQSAADRASKSGVDVAAAAKDRALQELTQSANLASGMRSQDYGEQAAKAEAQNAIDKFNATTSNSTNMYNTQTANAAQAANLAEKQRVADTNTQTTNANKVYNADAVQKQYQDALDKAKGTAGVYDQWGNDAAASSKADQAADLSLVGGALKTGATAAGTMLGGPAGGVAASGVTDIGGGNTTNSKYQQNPDGTYNFSTGGQVPNVNITPDDEADFAKFMAEMKSPTKMNKGGQVKEHMGTSNCYCGGGVCMSKGGFLGDLKKGALHKDLGVPSDKSIPAGKLEKATHSTDETLRKRAQFAENVKHWQHKAEGGEVTPAPSPEPKKEEKKKEDPGLIERLGNLLGAHADAANKIDSDQPTKGPYDFKFGGKVPGIPVVKGNSPKNDKVPAMLSPGEVVLPRTVVNKPEKIPNFVDKATGKVDHIASALDSLMKHKKETEGRI